ncbi:hypothetical protein KFL_000100210 [Klebsormidium nitens]|uniref:Uncharacterized protein n=1 Tax=Klebsormidium nitens TaxID=105231 RepID=A0A1Y1HIE4_KLENI|nr:hypothetical protein KFL_000100210 [Klebsormidium nitens]|eukprot:GAQ78255.1 hypothetical protein KFL_000100210 [Klebsormidium nitens]
MKKRTAQEAQAALKAKADPPDVPTSMSPLLKASLARQDLKKPQQSPEELKASEAAAKEYSRKMLHELRQKQLGLQQRIQLKWAAIAALPEGFLRDEASKEDLTPFPPRRIPTWTPPIPGFSNRDDASARDADRRRR